MLRNRSMPVAPVMPELVYPDVTAAVTWLCGAFGFTRRWAVGGHRAQVGIGDAAVVVMAADAADRALPSAGAVTHGVLVRVEDVDAHHATAAANGATILTAPEDFPYGERQYTALDLAGHRWVFSQSIADVDPRQWGAETGPAT